MNSSYVFSNMKIYPVISAIHLEQAKEDEFEREDPSTRAPGLIIMDGELQWRKPKELRGRFAIMISAIIREDGIYILLLIISAILRKY